MTFLISGSDGGFFPSWTTATRPASPAVGQMGYNTTTGLFDQYTAGGWSPVGATAGNVIQVVQGTYSTQASTTSTSFVTTNLTTSITPKFSTSKILVSVGIANAYISALSVNECFTIYRGATNISPAGTGVLTGFGVLRSDAASVQANVSFSYLDSPATTSSTAYTVYFASVQGNSVSINFNGAVSTIILMEIAA